MDICNQSDFFGPVCFITVGKEKQQLRLAQIIGFWIVYISQFNVKLLTSKKKLSVHLHYICTLCIIVKCLDRLYLIHVSVVILWWWNTNVFMLCYSQSCNFHVSCYNFSIVLFDGVHVFCSYNWLSGWLEILKHSCGHFPKYFSVDWEQEL